MTVEFTPDPEPEGVMTTLEPELVYGLELHPLIPGRVATSVLCIIESESEGDYGLSFRSSDHLQLWEVLGLLHAALRAAQRDFDALLPGAEYEEYEAFGEGEDEI